MKIKNVFKRILGWAIILILLSALAAIISIAGGIWWSGPAVIFGVAAIIWLAVTAIDLISQ